MSDNDLARVTLSQLTEAGDSRVGQLLETYGAAAVVDLIVKGPAGGVWSDDMDAGLQTLVPAEELLDAAERDGIRFITPTHPEWPQQLADLGRSQPVGVWAKGDLNLAEATSGSVAIVGSRSSTMYGTDQAQVMAADLSAAGRTVVSGAAFGIDQSAHRGALVAGGPTIAVMPCGVDRAYPSAHAQLLDTIANRGLVVSEQAPGSTPTRQSFLARSRLIAALSEGTVVVEAASRSGALHAANWATDLGRRVFAVPGPVTSATAQGPHQLIRHGQATLVTTADDVTQALQAGREAAAGAAGPGIDESYLPAPARGARPPARATAGRSVGPAAPSW